MQLKSLALTVKFLFLALFSIAFSLIPLIYGIKQEEYRVILVLFGISYSLFAYTFGGVEKNKLASFNNVITIYLITNILSSLIFFSTIGFWGLDLDLSLIFILFLFGLIIFPIIVFYTYSFLFRKIPAKRCLIIGSKDEWNSIILEFCNNSILPMEVVDFIELSNFSKESVLNSIETYPPINYIICTNFSTYNQIFLKDFKIPVLSINSLIENQCKRIPINVFKNFEEYYRLNFANLNMSRGARLIDTLVCLVCLTLSFPLLLIAGLLILIFDNGPIFFRQERHGLMGKIFFIYKLRTWDVDENGKLKSTLTGSLLRKMRLNEVPQFYNVLKGDMSLVGPRPDVPSTYNYCIEKIPFYHYRYFVRPGITGHAQVSYKYIDKLEVETFSNRLSYDLFYVKNNSFFLYLTTLIKTIESVIFLRGN